MDTVNRTIAINMLVHGEAVRFNRGKSRGDDYDFKYLQGTNGRKYPYVSSQCFKKYWRESLPGQPSPITREKNSKGEEKNQAFTSGNPFLYVDDDLFGYMIAGAAEAEEETTEAEEAPVEGVEQVDEAVESFRFQSEDVRSRHGLLSRFREHSPLAEYLLENLAPSDKELLERAKDAREPGDDVVEVLLQALNAAVKDLALYSQARFPKATAAQKKTATGGSPTEVIQMNRELLQKTFSKELEQKQKRPTTRRTAPIRMHALVAFGDVKLAKDFQTFSRDVALSGKNSILNPNPVGIYSGWLRTRILIEAHRIGRFYIGANLDILEDMAQGREILTEPNPYSRVQERVRLVSLDEESRRQRVREAIEALANVGNRQGPASGALHDGSLRPRAFIGGVMNCSDSPFDSLWVEGEACPKLEAYQLRAVLKDWSDLFASRVVYIGLPIEGMSAKDEGMTEKHLQDAAGDAGFEAIIGTPRQTLLTLAREAAACGVS